jgi:TDG/mug DNA glycosylase family protein
MKIARTPTGQAMGTNRPTRAELLAAKNKTVPDVIAPGLAVLFCGINPGLYTAAIGHHFGRPGNRFWPALHAAGITDRLLSPWEDATLLERGCGLTNLVARATSKAEELTDEELWAGGRRLRRKLRRWTPACVAVLGVTAYRTAFGFPDAILGRQPKPLSGATVWVLPSPSGLNAHYRLTDLGRLFAEFWSAIERR